MAVEVLSIRDLDSVLNEVYIVRYKWYHIGLGLKVPSGTLDSFRSQFRDQGDLLTEVLKAWLKRKRKTTWRILTRALKSRAVGERRLASDLKEKYCPKVQIHPTVGQPVGVDGAILKTKETIRKLKVKLSTVVNRTQKSVEQTGIGFSEVRNTILLLPASKCDENRKLFESRSHIVQSHSIDELFGWLCCNLDYLNTDLLEDVVDIYGDEETKHMMEEFTREVEVFRRETPLHVFWKATKAGSMSSDLKELRIEHSGLSPQSTLEEVDTFRRAYAREYSLREYAVMLAKTKDGSVMIIFLVPPSVVPLLLKSKDTFFQEHHILSVTLDDILVYENDEPPVKAVLSEDYQSTTETLEHAGSSANEIGHPPVESSDQEEPMSSQTHETAEEQVKEQQATCSLHKREVVTSQPSGLQNDVGELQTDLDSKFRVTSSPKVLKSTECTSIDFVDEKNDNPHTEMKEKEADLEQRVVELEQQPEAVTLVKKEPDLEDEKLVKSLPQAIQQDKETTVRSFREREAVQKEPDLQKKMDEMRKQCKIHTEKLAAKDKKLRELFESHKQLQSELQSKEQLIINLRLQIEQLQADYESLKSQYTELQAIYREVEDKNEHMKEMASILQFHPKCGGNAQVTDDGLVVKRTGMHHSAMAMTGRPLRTLEMFEVEVTAVDDEKIWGNNISLGVTLYSPEIINYPTYMYALKTGTWNVDHSPTSIDLQVNSVKRHRKLRPDTVPLKCGDRIGLQIASDKSLIVFINGENLGPFRRNIPEGVYGFVDLRGQCVGVKLCSKTKLEATVFRGTALKFHQRCGVNVVLKDDGATIERKGEHYSHAIALTCRPLAIDELFEVEVTSTAERSGMWFTHLSFGITVHRPEITDFPSHMYNMKSGTWHFERTTGGIDLILKRVATGKRRKIPTTDTFGRGERLGLRIESKRRSLVVYLNGKNMGGFASHIPEGAYGFVDLGRGECKGVKITSAAPFPMPEIPPPPYYEAHTVDDSDAGTPYELRIPPDNSQEKKAERRSSSGEMEPRLQEPRLEQINEKKEAQMDNIIQLVQKDEELTSMEDLEIMTRPTLQEFQALKWKGADGVLKRICIMDTVASEWHEFGKALGLLSSDIGAIEAECNRNATERVFNLWVHKAGNCSWDGLLEALENAGFNDSAHDLRKALPHKID